MFRRLPDPGAEEITVSIDGTPVTVRTGDSVAAVLLAAGRIQCRTTPVSGAARGSYCLMGVCFECLVEIDGVGNRQACMIRVAPGMAIATQNGRREAGR
ncbi:MAG TPA: (2Fe-2S)-binding protein [Acetobacteraceae bacterium]|nr:(2Fe-2S)-binding protein [Acetobacteraceae bacterium]